MLAEVSVNLFAAIFAEHKHTPFCPPKGGFFILQKNIIIHNILQTKHF